jgi:hypothetical protein
MSQNSLVSWEISHIYFVLQCYSFEQLSVAIQQSKHALLQVALFFYPMGQNPFSRRHRAMDGWVG